MDLLQPAERASLHVSVSQIKSYLLCPRRYAHLAVMRTPAPIYA